MRGGFNSDIANGRNAAAWPVGFSIGAITVNRMPSDVEQLIAQCDGLMYQVKRQGKNRWTHQQIELSRL